MREKKNNSLLLITGIVVLIASIIGVYIVFKDNSINSNSHSVLASAMEADVNDDSEKITAVDFKATDSAGNGVEFSQFIGKPVVLVFWASWSDSSVLHLDDLQTVYNEYKDKSIDFAAVNVTDGKKETLDMAEDFILENGYTFPVWYDIQGEGVDGYGIRSLPSTLFIDGEGKIIAAVEGALSKSSLEHGISSID